MALRVYKAVGLLDIFSWDFERFRLIGTPNDMVITHVGKTKYIMRTFS